ncbi:MAG: hypothetical protein J6F31_10190 [Oscillospiraceae bacterium]|nr:hypothetical protein [Oscillospiraceae bacterium]
MRRKKEIFLDFTSLLDVTMIILFFFIITYSTQTAKAVTEAEERKKAAEESLERAAVLEKELEEEKESLMEERAGFEEERNRELERLYGASERTAYDIAAMNAFDKGNNVKIYLDNENIYEDGWKIRIYSGNEEIKEISKGTDIAKGIKSAFEAAGITSEDVILAEMIYDGSKRDSYNAYESTDKALKALRNEYTNLYVSMTDLHGMKERMNDNE